ncbi:MAG TPA: hypothetical protein VIN61_04060 [Gammaproteobacteria bacterium]
MSARDRAEEVAREIVDADSAPTSDTGLLLMVAQGYLKGLQEGIARSQAALAKLGAVVKDEIQRG